LPLNQGDWASHENLPVKSEEKGVDVEEERTQGGEDATSNEGKGEDGSEEGEDVKEEEGGEPIVEEEGDKPKELNTEQTEKNQIEKKKDTKQKSFIEKVNDFKDWPAYFFYLILLLLTICICCFCCIWFKPFVRPKKKEDEENRHYQIPQQAPQMMMAPTMLMQAPVGIPVEAPPRADFVVGEEVRVEEMHQVGVPV